MSIPDDQIEAVQALQRWFDERGYVLILHQPGASNEDVSEEDRAQLGWSAPYQRKDVVTGVAAYGWGKTPLAAAQDAQARFEAEEGPRQGQ